MSTRLERLQGRLEQPLLVTSPINLLYLTGLRSSNAALLVEQERVRLYTDFRYADAAAEVRGVEFVQSRRDLYGHLAELLGGTVAFEAADLTVDRHLTLAAAGLDLVPVRGIVEELRQVKDEQELDAIRRAAEITNEAYARLAQERFVGRSERELARWLAIQYLDLGADGVAFDVGLGAGPRSALPHCKPTDAPIERGATLIVDSGALVDGYRSDCTRTFATGELPPPLAEAYEVCLDAQQRALAAIRPGLSGREADAVAREPIAEAGLGERFGHSLGHGIGLEVHEAPTLGPLSTQLLAAGQVVTVEPGIYLPGLGGVRIEDLVVVGRDGPEVLTTFAKEIVLLG